MFRVHLSQQVQILQKEYPGRIQQEHVEEVKLDHFYEGLSPECWQMLAHKVNGENPVTFPELLLTAWKLGKMGRSKRPPAPENPYYWEFKCNSFSLTSESISIQEIEG